MADFTRAAWRKSTRSNQNGACVEVAIMPGLIGVRDTKNRDAGHLEFAAEEWTSFTAAVKLGRFDA